MNIRRGRSSGVVLVGLLLGTFVTGSAELLTAGLLPPISSGLGVSVAAAGSLFSAYALGLAIGGPLLTAATIRLDRRPVLVGAMALFAIMVVAPAVAAALRVVRRHPAGGRSAAGPVPGRGLHHGHRDRPAGARRSGAGGRHRRVLGLDRPRSAVGRTRRIGARVARGAADRRWRSPSSPPACWPRWSRVSRAAGLGRERTAARPGPAGAGDARTEPGPVRGARRGDGLPDAPARARHRSVRTAGESHPRGVRRGECRGLLPGRPARRPRMPPGPWSSSRSVSSVVGRCCCCWRAASRVLAVAAILAWAVFASSAPASVQYRVHEPRRPGRRSRRVAPGLRGERGHRPRLDRERTGLHRGRAVGRGRHRDDHRARRARPGRGDPTAGTAVAATRDRVDIYAG